MNLYILFISIIFSLLYQGCQSASNLLHSTIIPVSHNNSLKEAKIGECDFESALLEVHKNKSLFLKNVESGLLLFYQKDFIHSKIFFEKAIFLYRKDEDKPLFALSDFAVLDYNGEGYDKVFLHNYNALNYLLLGDLENARVETKNSDFIQQKERERFYQKIQHYRPHVKQSIILFNRYEKLFSYINPSHNPYQNPFAFYLSALLFEEKGRLDDAKIDIRHALAFAPDLYMLQERLESYNHKRTREKRVELFFDIGRSPVKTQQRVPVKVSREKEMKLYLPSFTLYKSQIDKIVLLNKKKEVVASSCTLSDINAIKINAFKKQLPFILDKIIMEISKEAFGNTVVQKNKIIAPFYEFFKVLYSQNNLLTWTTLPQRIDILSFIPENGEIYTLEARNKDGKILDHIPLYFHCNSRLKNCYKHYVIKKDRFCK